MSEGVPSALARSQGLDSLKLDPGHGALGHGGSLLQILEDELAAGSANQASPVRLRVVRQPSSVGDALNHLENDRTIEPQRCISFNFRSIREINKLRRNLKSNSK